MYIHILLYNLYSVRSQFDKETTPLMTLNWELRN